MNGGDQPVHTMWDAPPRSGGRVRIFVLGALALLAFGPNARGQSTSYELDDSRGWVTAHRPEPGTDEETIGRARSLLAEGKARQARSMLNAWLDQYEDTDNPRLAEAYLLRGDARTATGSEYWALYDYEEITKNFQASEVFEKAVEREFEIGRRYLNGLRTKFLWMRIEDAAPLGEELMVRVQERLPGSRLAERACLELADYYYRERDLGLAAETYDIFLKNFPRSEYRQKAMQRQIYANIARFKGPQYDASGLVEAQYLIKEFVDRYPAEAERSGISDALLARLDESAGAQMLETARWYVRRGDTVSARFTLSRLLRKHPQTTAAAVGRRIMAENGWVPEDQRPADLSSTASEPDK